MPNWRRSARAARDYGRCKTNNAVRCAYTLRQCVILAVVPAPSCALVGLEIREAQSSDLDWIARLHALRLPHGFFVRLGRRYLRAYHRSFMVSPDGVALVAEREGHRVGFVVGATRAGAHRRFVLRKQGVRLGVIGACALAVRPAVAAEFIRTRLFRYARSVARALGRSHTCAPGSAAAAVGCAVLAHVAVDPGLERGGAGSALVDAFTDAVAEAGVTRVELVTLADERGAAEFYERLGWRSADAGVVPDAVFRRFVLELP